MGAAFLASILDLFFPPRCFLCACQIKDEGEKALCPECLGKIRLIGPLFCSCCGFPFPFHRTVSALSLPGVAGNAEPAAREGRQGERLCGPCLSQKRALRLCRQAGYYEGILLQAIHKFKYSRQTALARPLGAILAKTASSLLPKEEYQALIPVPLHTRRLREREFNQSLLLARRVGKSLGIGLDYANLIKVKWTEPQVGLTFADRRKNVRGAFAVKYKEKVQGRCLLLVDDVMTSGATLEECARTLMKAGARAVDGLALARAVGQEDTAIAQP